ncbi:winged helix DNA-binding domain-containing protein [Hanseniaspora valbyensis NRRL Y-1626]|uniref:Winged helix DNA-binding domain-containing protein n=1 Tax=Hanseniaspora valbyensis NRRL Y-1626 TaxID=766949 RepID=A0A1B7TFK6_9ASCO|nr:winged helix DNA-binding domain-containing protein [Hanseniaspora valbyensis NRRL Y-1626]
MDSNTEKLTKLYNFKPMYTKQENSKVLKTQIDTWCDIIKQHYRFTKNFKFSTKVNKSLFENGNLKRSLDDKFQKEIIDKLYKDKILINLIPLKNKLLSDKKFAKTWNSSSNPTPKSDLLIAKHIDLESKEDEVEISYTTFILFESVDFFADLFLEYMDMNSGKDNIFTIYELSKCDMIFSDKRKSPFIEKLDTFDDGDDDYDSVPEDLIVYIVYKGLIDKNIACPIFEDEELVAIKKI